MWKNKGNQMYNSDPISIPNCAFDNPWVCLHRESDSYFSKTSLYSKGIGKMEKTTTTIITVFVGPRGGRTNRFKQTRSTHSGAEEKETLNKKLWDKSNLYPMCKKTRAIECTIQMQFQFWIVHSIALALLHRRSDIIFLETWKLKTVHS